MHDALRAVPCATSGTIGGEWVEYPSGVRERRKSPRDEVDARVEEAQWRKFEQRFLKGRPVGGPRDVLAAVSDAVDSINELPLNKNGELPVKAYEDAGLLSVAFRRSAGEILGFEPALLGFKHGRSRRVLVGALVDSERRYALNTDMPGRCIRERRNNLVLLVDMLEKRDLLGAEHGLASPPGAFMLLG